MKCETNSDWIDTLDLDDGLWLDLLVDDELTIAQRQRYLSYVAERNRWQSLATAFLDEQVVRAGMVTETHTGAARVERSAPQRWNFPVSVALAAVLIMGVLIGSIAFRSGDPGRELADSPSEQTDRGTRPTATAGVESLPALFQVRDDDHEAVYFADYSVPQFFLDALILAGHDVILEQQFLGYTESKDDPSAVPVNVIRVRKYGQILVSLDQEHIQ